MFEGFTLERIDVGDAELRVRHGGSGPAVLLLHGHPRTHVTWHQVAPRLAEQFTVVCPELAFWTSMLDPLSEATLPVAPMGALAGVVAAPAAEATAPAASSAVAPVPARRMKRRRLLLRLVSDCIVLIPLSLPW